LTTSVFNKRADERQALLDLFQHIERFKLCIFSYWSKEHNTEWFETLFIEAGLNFVNKQVDHQYVYSTKKGVNNSQAGVRTEWTGDQRKQAGQQEILYFLKAK
jgi:pyocin large subunit-like protein